MKHEFQSCELLEFGPAFLLLEARVPEHDYTALSYLANPLPASSTAPDQEAFGSMGALEGKILNGLGDSLKDKPWR
eukprot:3452002-Amphidinium_carterae.1